MLLKFSLWPCMYMCMFGPTSGRESVMKHQYFKRNLFFKRQCMWKAAIWRSKCKWCPTKHATFITKLHHLSFVRWLQGYENTKFERGHLMFLVTFLLPLRWNFFSSLVLLCAIALVRVVQSLIQQKNLYPLDSTIGFPNIYLLDSNLSSGQRYPTFE